MGLSYRIIEKILCDNELKRLHMDPDIEKTLNKYIFIVEIFRTYSKEEK